MPDLRHGRTLGTDAEGHDLLCVRGAAGAVVLEAWEFEGTALGALAFHSPVPWSEGQQGFPCERIERGVCYPDADLSLSKAFRAAELWLGGRRQDAWAIVEEAYWRLPGWAHAPGGWLATFACGAVCHYRGEPKAGDWLSHYGAVSGCQAPHRVTEVKACPGCPECEWKEKFDASHQASAARH